MQKENLQKTERTIKSFTAKKGGEFFFPIGPVEATHLTPILTLLKADGADIVHIDLIGHAQSSIYTGPGKTAMPIYSIFYSVILKTGETHDLSRYDSSNFDNLFKEFRETYVHTEGIQ